MLRYPLVMFDMDGTFISSIVFHTKVFHRFLNRYVGSFGMEEVRTKMGATVRHIYAQCGIADEDMERMYVLLDEFIHEGIDDLVMEIPIIDGIREALKEVREAGAKTVVVTNSMQYVAERVLELHGLREFFNDVSGADPHSMDKATRMQALAAKYDRQPCDFIYIGDTEGDVQIARKIGCAAGFSKTPFSWYSDLSLIENVLKPEHTFTHFSQMARAIGNYVEQRNGSEAT